jgi:hypothetical protein
MAPASSMARVSAWRGPQPPRRAHKRAPTSRDSSRSLPQNLAAWAVAGGAAYVLWIRPEKAEKAARAAASARSRGGAGVDRVSPTPNLHNDGQPLIIKGGRGGE